MPRLDISYDYEDFGMTADQLASKYQDHSRHPEYSVTKWHADPTKDNFNGYWDWVVSQIAKDDDEALGHSPDANGTPITLMDAVADMGTPGSVEDPIVDIQSVEQFGQLISHWHENMMARMRNLRGMPFGSSVTLTEGGKKTTVTLKGDGMKGFQAGLNAAIAELQDFPFVFSVDLADEVAAANDDAAPSN